MGFTLKQQVMGSAPKQERMEFTLKQQAIGYVLEALLGRSCCGVQSQLCLGGGAALASNRSSADSSPTQARREAQTYERNQRLPMVGMEPLPTWGLTSEPLVTQLVLK